MTIQREELERFGDIFPHMENILQCGIYYHNSLSQQMFWSKGMYDLLSLEPNSIEPSLRSFVPFIVPEDRERVIKAVQQSRETRTPYKLEFSIIDASQKYKRIYAENSFRREENEPGSYEGIAKDITENHYYKKALEQKVQQLDKSNQSLQEFVYIASHDLQEPLRKISTFVGRLKSRFAPSLGEEGEMYVARILNSTQNMQTLLEDLLNFSRLSFTDKQFEKVDLNECLKAVLSDLEIKIEETRADIKYPSLPAIEGYTGQIKQLFNNLLNNALKFRQEGVNPRIEIQAEEIIGEAEKIPQLKNIPYLRIMVKDNGIGFEQEFSEKIFKIFQRLNGKSEYPGSGVGLSICKRIVDNHHGIISAEGRPNNGAIFTIFLPLKQTS